MSTYCYKSRDGAEIEAEYPIGSAPQSIRRGGKRYTRMVTMPAQVVMSGFQRGEKPSRAHSLPTYYGYRQGRACWDQRMRELGLPNEARARQFVSSLGLQPPNAMIERKSREAAERAGALDQFDRKGRCMASTKRGLEKIKDRAKKLGDELAWD